MKKYDIKTTDTETLKKWYHLMVLGRALDEKAPSYLVCPNLHDCKIQFRSYRIPLP